MKTLAPSVFSYLPMFNEINGQITQNLIEQECLFLLMIHILISWVLFFFFFFFFFFYLGQKLTETTNESLISYILMTHISQLVVIRILNIETWTHARFSCDVSLSYLVRVKSYCNFR